MIPVTAKFFVYINVDPNLEQGGFLYLAADGSPLAINRCTFKPTGNALCFADRQKVSLTGQQCEQLRDVWMKIPEGRFTDMGATDMCWVGPDVKLGGLDGQRMGGFAYLFESEVSFFPLKGGGRTILRSDKLEGDMDVHTALLGKDSSYLEVQDHLTGEQGLRPVRIAQLTLSDPLHPVLFQALQSTPRRQAVETIAARAIVNHGWARVRRFVVLSLVLDFVGLVALAALTFLARLRLLAHNATVPCLGVLGVVTLKVLAKESLVVYGYLCKGLPRDYLVNWRCVTMARCAVMLVVIVWCAVMEETDKHFRVQPLLALGGVLAWVDLLWHLRGFGICRLGQRIIPIVKSLGDVTDFLIIVVFALLAVAQAYFALTSSKAKSFLEVAFAAYRLGLLADFEIQDDIHFEQVDSGEFIEDDWEQGMASYLQPWQYVAFIIASFVVSVALTNIFIAVMSNAYDHYSDKVGELFIRARACICLEYILCLRIQGADDNRRIWFCYSEDPEASTNTTLRGAIADAKAQHSAEISAMEAKINRILTILDDGGLARQVVAL